MARRAMSLGTGWSWQRGSVIALRGNHAPEGRATSAALRGLHLFDLVGSKLHLGLHLADGREDDDFLVVFAEDLAAEPAAVFEDEQVGAALDGWGRGLGFALGRRARGEFDVPG